MVTSPPGEGFRPCDLSHDRRATSCVLPSSGDATFWPFRSAADLMTYFVIRKAPPDVAPEMILIAPLEVRKALTAGFGPMYAASSAPESRAVTSSGPALKVLRRRQGAPRAQASGQYHCFHGPHSLNHCEGPYDFSQAPRNARIARVEDFDPPGVVSSGACRSPGRSGPAWPGRS